MVLGLGTSRDVVYLAWMVDRRISELGHDGGIYVLTQRWKTGTRRSPLLFQRCSNTVQKRNEKIMFRRNVILES